jgi:RepB DNA-primase from phage plasmid
MNQFAADFLIRSFAPDETIAILLRREKPAATMQRIVALERVLAPRYLAWLSHENGDGANIYVAANPLRPGSRKRTKESIACVRHLYLDIDTDGDVRLANLQASTDVPSPTTILSTSPGKYQVLWQVAGFDFEGQEEMLKLLTIVFGGDPACTDRNRVLRVPGFLNHKYEPAHLVTAQYPCDSVWTSNDFKMDKSTVDVEVYERATVSRQQPGKHSNSESDWAWVSRGLACGIDAQKLTRQLASRRADKSNPLYYAQRTVDVASARLWLSDGIRIDDVVTMLEVRRRFEIPAALCSARAREIAATANRIIVRRKIA